jgi:TLD
MVEKQRLLFCCCGRPRDNGAIVTHERFTSEKVGEKTQDAMVGNEEDDLHAVRSWRQQRNSSTALVIVNVEPKLQRIDEGDENSLSLPPPIEEIEGIPPSSPLNHSVEPENVLTETELARTWDNFSHVSGGFPTFSPEEEEWRKQQAILKEAYLSSSSASTSSTVEDPVLRRSPVDLDQSFDTGAEGPVDLDRLEDHLLINTSLSRRPEPDDGDSPPLGAFSSLTHSNEEGIAESKDSSSLDWKHMDLVGLKNSSDELDAMVAAIDHGLGTTPQNVSPPVRISPSRRDSPSIFDPTFMAADAKAQQSSSPTAAESAQYRRIARNRFASIPDSRPKQPVISSQSVVASKDSPVENSGLDAREDYNHDMWAMSMTKPYPLEKPAHALLSHPDAGQSSPQRENSTHLLRSLDHQHPSPRREQAHFSRNEQVKLPIRHSVPDAPNSVPKGMLMDLLPEDPVQVRDSDGVDDGNNRAEEYSSPHLSIDQTEEDNEDLLSNIPSEADPQQKERYLKACRILKTALLEKDPSLPLSDQEFLAQLLLETTPSKDSSDQLTEDRIRFYESTAHQLRASPPLMDNATSIVSTDGGAQQTKWEDSATMTIPPPYQIQGVTERELLWHDRRFPTPGLQQRSSPSQVSSSLFSRVDQDDYPFQWIGDVSRFDRKGSRPQVLTTRLMCALRGFLPDPLRGHNFWWKFAWHARDSPPIRKEQESSLQSLLKEIQFTPHTIICVETVDGRVFGAFCSSTWGIQESWFGSIDCFLWRLKHARLEENSRGDTNDNEMEIYPYTGADNLIQYCTPHTLAVGGGTDWSRLVEGGGPYGPDEPTGIGFLLDGDLMGGETSACTTFANPRLGNRDSGGNEFDIRYLEVWTLTPCETLEEAQERELSMLPGEDVDQRTSSDF